MASRTLATWAASIGLLGALLISLLWVLNVPFYSGAGGAHWRWRMEHGRLRVVHRLEPANPESFYIASNSEGLRFSPEWKFHSRHDWMINVPLWVPWVACMGLAGLGITLARMKARD